MLVYQSISQPSVPIWRTPAINIGVTYSVSVSLDVLLTIMIIARLLLLNKEIRKAMNAPLKSSGMYRAVITVISESSALYVVTFVLFIGTWAVDDPSEYFFFPVLAQAQVRTFPTFPQYVAIFGPRRLIVVTNRSSLRS